MIAPGVMPEPRVADLVQPFRQHVLQEAAHELMAVEARWVPAPRCAMLVADGDTVVIEPDDAAFGDCHSKDVACQIAQHGLGAIAPGCAMDDPGLPSGRFRQDEIGPAFGQSSSHLGPHEDCERPGRDQEVIAGGMPVATVIGHAATGDEAMDMRMAEPSLKIPGIIISLIFCEQRKLVFRATPLQN